jgi:hypothetical protein
VLLSVVPYLVSGEAWRVARGGGGNVAQVRDGQAPASACGGRGAHQRPQLRACACCSRLHAQQLLTCKFKTNYLKTSNYITLFYLKITTNEC